MSSHLARPELAAQAPAAPDIAATSSLGHAALNGNPGLSPNLAGESGQTLEFTSDEYNLLGLAALGLTPKEVAQLLPATYEDEAGVRAMRDKIRDKFGASNMTASVNQAILKGILQIEVEKNPPVIDLNEDELKILDVLADGKGDAQIVIELGVKKAIARNIKKGMFDKLRVPGERHTGRTRSLVRAYELGIFKIPSEQ